MPNSGLENRIEQCGKLLETNLSEVNVSGSCFDHICELPKAKGILKLGLPNRCNWNSEVLGSPVWKGFLHFSSGLFALLFLSFAIVCIFLLIRRHKIDRFMIKTTLAVLITLSILGFSRAALSIIVSVALDGKCGGGQGPLACLILMRFSDALGFPSLTASYTLVFLTLVLASKIRIGPECLQKPRLLIPLALVHYVVAIVFEIVGLVSPGPAYITLVVCEAFYTLWGIFVCVAYMVIGIRLIKQIRHAIRTTSLVVRRKQKQRFSIGKRNTNRSEVTKLTREVKIHHQRALRKVTCITYFAAAFGIVYSLINVARLVFNVFVINSYCEVLSSEDAAGQSPISWLVLTNVSRALELLLGILLAYSVTDISPYIQWFKNICGKKEEPSIPLAKRNILLSENSAGENTLKLNGQSNGDLKEKMNLDEEEEFCDLSKTNVDSADNSSSAETLQVGLIPPMISISNDSLSSSDTSKDGEIAVKQPNGESVSLLVVQVDSPDPESEGQSSRRTSCPSRPFSPTHKNSLPTQSLSPAHKDNCPSQLFSSPRKMSCPSRPFSTTGMSSLQPQTAEKTTQQVPLSSDTYAVIGVSMTDIQAALQTGDQEQTKDHQKVSLTNSVS